MGQVCQQPQKLVDKSLSLRGGTASAIFLVGFTVSPELTHFCGISLAITDVSIK